MNISRQILNSYISPIILVISFYDVRGESKDTND